jgi:hypothetical protein
METSEMWTVTVRSRFGEHLSFTVPAPDIDLAIATARGLARAQDSFGLWRWPLVSVTREEGDWQLREALDGRR